MFDEDHILHIYNSMDMSWISSFYLFAHISEQYLREVNLRKQLDAPFQLLLKGVLKAITRDIVFMAMWTDSYTAEWGALADT